MKKFKYIEIKGWNDGGVARRLDVTDRTDTGIELIRSGLNKLLNHDKYYTTNYESDTELDII